jgi:hypothetical protein
MYWTTQQSYQKNEESLEVFYWICLNLDLLLSCKLLCRSDKFEDQYEGIFEGTNI